MVKAVAGSPVYRSEDARLIALAPDLARLCAELGEALERVQTIVPQPLRNGHASYFEDAQADGAHRTIDSALAKLAELEAR